MFSDLDFDQLDQHEALVHMATAINGRLSLSDTTTLTLAPYFESGFLDRPRDVPPWARDTRRLAASLACSSFMMNVNPGGVTLDQFVQPSQRNEG